MFHLRPYQQHAIDNIRTYFKKGKKLILQAPTGSGKTVIFSVLSKLVSEKGNKILIMTDRVELLTQAGGSIKKAGLNSFYIQAGTKIVSNSFDCYIAMSQTFRRRIELDYWQEFLNTINIVIIDECFIAGTKIDNKNIEDIKIGDYVNSFNHVTNGIEQKKVINTFKNKIQNDLIKINLCCDFIVCTKKHPIFVAGKGYINAEKIKNGDKIIRNKMHTVRRSNKKGANRCSKMVEQKTKFFSWAKCCLFKRMYFKNTFEKNEKNQSYAHKKNKKKSIGYIKKNGSQTTCSWRKRQRNDKISKKAYRMSWRRMVSGISYCYRKWISSISLQNRYRKSSIKNSNRSRWQRPRYIKSKKSRPKKNKSFTIERVQSVEIYKRRNNERCKQSNKKNYVYNLEVQDNNNYFANNILVHNCHKQEFNYLFEGGYLADKFVIGFTATPKRSGSMRQLALDYQTIIPTVSVRKLIADNYLVNDDYYGLDSPDMSDVQYDYMKGDYKEGQMFQKFNTPQLYSGVVKNYSEICPLSKTLVFCVNIEHVIRTVVEFQNKGIDAKFITSKVSHPKKPEDVSDKGKMARYEERMRVYELHAKYFKLYSGKRENIFKDFKDGKFTVLVNAGIATTGYDCPSIETIILNRATTSTTLLLQMIGRGSRIHESKTHFNILDFGGNCQRLGHYSEDRNWGLWHEKKEGKGLPPLKECGFTLQGKPIKKGGCRRLILASYKICPFCGFKYPDKKAKEIDLQALMYDGQKAVKTKRVKNMTLNELNIYWKAKGHKTAWLWRQLWYKGKHVMIEEFGKRYGWSNMTIKKAINFCENF